VTGLAIAGWGTALPEQRVTNADLAERFDTTDEWIVARTGIRERRVAGDDESTATLAVAAGAEAIKNAGLTPDDVGLLIVATATPEQPLPPTAAFVQEGIGLRCGGFDLGAACAGFVYGLVAGTAFLSLRCEAVLLVASETLTRIVDPADRSTFVLFGDGAAACVLIPGERGGLLGWDLGCDGSAAGLLSIPAGGSRCPTTVETAAAGEHWLRMDGREVFRRAVRVVVDSAHAALDDAGLTVDDVDVFVPHQANLRIVEAAASRLSISLDRTVVNLDRFGNTSAASIPIACAEGAAAGRIHDGDVVLLSGFGAGMTWGSAVLRWEGRD